MYETILLDLKYFVFRNNYMYSLDEKITLVTQAHYSKTIAYKMLKSDVLNCMILPLFSMMTMCSVEYWLWILPSFQRMKKKQRITNADLQNKSMDGFRVRRQVELCLQLTVKNL